MPRSGRGKPGAPCRPSAQVHRSAHALAWCWRSGAGPHPPSRRWATVPAAQAAVIRHRGAAVIAKSGPRPDRTRVGNHGPVRKSAALRSTLSHALCHLISSMDDLMPQVIICVPQFCHQYFCESAIMAFY